MPPAHTVELHSEHPAEFAASPADSAGILRHVGGEHETKKFTRVKRPPTEVISKLPKTYIEKPPPVFQGLNPGA